MVSLISSSLWKVSLFRGAMMTWNTLNLITFRLTSAHLLLIILFFSTAINQAPLGSSHVLKIHISQLRCNGY